MPHHQPAGLLSAPHSPTLPLVKPPPPDDSLAALAFVSCTASAASTECAKAHDDSSIAQAHSMAQPPSLPVHGAAGLSMKHEPEEEQGGNDECNSDPVKGVVEELPLQQPHQPQEAQRHQSPSGLESAQSSPSSSASSQATTAAVASASASASGAGASSMLATSAMPVRRARRRPRRATGELELFERWSCPKGCGKVYRKNSTVSIRKHVPFCNGPAIATPINAALQSHPCMMSSPGFHHQAPSPLMVHPHMLHPQAPQLLQNVDSITGLQYAHSYSQHNMQLMQQPQQQPHFHQQQQQGPPGFFLGSQHNHGGIQLMMQQQQQQPPQFQHQQLSPASLLNHSMVPLSSPSSASPSSLHNNAAILQSLQQQQAHLAAQQRELQQMQAHAAQIQMQMQHDAAMRQQQQQQQRMMLMQHQQQQHQQQQSPPLMQPQQLHQQPQQQPKQATPLPPSLPQSELLSSQLLPFPAAHMQLPSMPPAPQMQGLMPRSTALSSVPVSCGPVSLLPPLSPPRVSAVTSSSSSSSSCPSTAASLTTATLLCSSAFKPVQRRELVLALRGGRTTGIPIALTSTAP